MIGIDLEQFVRDPQGSGIQRVLQQLATHWPETVPAHFLMPDPDRDGVLVQMEASTAAGILGIAFSELPEDADLQAAVHSAIRDTSSSRISSTAITDAYSHWLLPEVSYLPTVLGRLEVAVESMRTAMIGYDALPMTEPANYRFKPGSSAWVSEYFRMLAMVDAVACISEYSKNVITQRLRRSTMLSTTITHPGGDHVPIRRGNPPVRTRFCRVGTMEDRKRPLEILEGFTSAVDAGLDAELVFIGRRSSSKDIINRRVGDAIARGYPIVWIEDASDHQVLEAVNNSSAFLSFGIEGYGIPLLEAIRVGTPVFFDGIQPAAELMRGRGAQHVESATSNQMTALLLHAEEHLETARRHLDPNSVPTWQNFTDDVVQSLLAS